MILSEFSKQPRGPARFETWLWNNRVQTILGGLAVELYAPIDTQPNDAMANLASELAEYAKANDKHLLDLIHGHYLYAEMKGWLNFWNVPTSLARSEILSQVESVILNVDSELFSSVYVNPLWDPEHKLCLTYEDGKISQANDSPFSLRNGILTPV